MAKKKSSMMMPGMTKMHSSMDKEVLSRKKKKNPFAKFNKNK